jgi:hypothetical protein
MSPGDYREDSRLSEDSVSAEDLQLPQTTARRRREKELPCHSGFTLSAS